MARPNDYSKRNDPEILDASKRISEKLAQINTLYEECAEIAREYDMCFSYQGPAGYGDGGSFDSERVGTTDRYGDERTGWLASSQNC